MNRFFQLSSALLIALTLVACGGSGADSASTDASFFGDGKTPTSQAPGKVPNKDDVDPESAPKEDLGNAPSLSSAPSPSAAALADPESGTARGRVNYAIRTGDASALSDSDLKSYMRQKSTEMDTKRKHLATIANSFYADASSAYDPTGSSQYMVPKNLTEAWPFIVGDKGNALASLSEVGKTRALAYGSNVLRKIANNPKDVHAAVLDKALRWLVTGSVSGAWPSDMSIAFVNFDSTVGMSGFKALNLNATSGVCAGLKDKLPRCNLSKAKLIVFGSDFNFQTPNPTLEADIQALINEGKPLMHVNPNRWWASQGYNDSLDLFLSKIGIDPSPEYGNVYAKDAASNRASADNSAAIAKGTGELDVFTKIANDTLKGSDYDWTLFNDKLGLQPPAAEKIRSAVLEPFQKYQARLNLFDQLGVALFKEPDTEVLRALVLWADIQRRTWVRDANRLTNPDAFLRKYATDHLVSYLRPAAQAQADLGSAMTKDWASYTPKWTQEEVTVNLTRAKGVTAVGRLAWPGVAFDATLISVQDATGNELPKAKIKLGVHNVRSNTSRILEAGDNAYRRPATLSSPRLVLSPNKTLQMVTPYGGPLYLDYEDAAAKGISKVKLRLKNAVVMPMLDYTKSAPDIAAFTKSLVDLKAVSWAHFKARDIEVTYRIDLIKPEFLTTEYMTGHIDEVLNHWLYGNYKQAGYVSDQYSMWPSVEAFCKKKGWDCSSDIHAIPENVQLVNSDQSQCGALCAGSPIDMWGFFLTRGWGQNHEIGHNSSRNDLYVHGRSSSVEIYTNVFALNAQYREIKSLPNPNLNDVRYAPKGTTFDQIMQSREADDPIEKAREIIWSDTSYAANGIVRLNFYLTWIYYWMERQKNAGVADYLDRGWDIQTLMHLNSRLRDAKSLDWNTVKDSLGYDTYAERPPSDISGNDNLLIILGNITGYDQRATFDMWGVTYSKEAAAQVAKLPKEPWGSLLYVTPKSRKLEVIFKQWQRVNMDVAKPVLPYEINY